ncbi:MAG TPA: response regulator transcription factor [Acidimicrobiia bacterium]|nr:response regulator transcription factor [Acidimicrobiia bacterium]
MATRVLVVDDEPKIRDVLRRYLMADGFEVSEAATGEEGLERLRAFHPDVVVLDVRLPGMDGFEVLAELRKTSTAYVLMLTARAEEVDKLLGLTLGADDYVSKPFSPREVSARVKALLRRSRAPETAAGDILDLGVLRIDHGRRLVSHSGSPVDLTVLEFDLLAALASAPGRVFTRRQLLERVWGWDFFGDERVVDVHIRNVRHALNDDAHNPNVIATVRGVGYRLVENPR